MAEFPKDFAAQAALRTTRLLSDNGASNGTVTPADMFGTLLLSDFLPKLMIADDQIDVIAATVTSYAIKAADKNKILLFLCSGACAVTVPPAISPGFFVQWVQWGTGILTFQPATGSSQAIRSAAGLRSLKQYGSGSLQTMQSNEWLLSGYTQV